MADGRKKIPTWGAAAIVAAVTALVFLPGVGHGFVNWDDEKNFTDNPHYRGLSAAHLQWMFTTFHMGHYQPLAWVTLAFDHAVWGMNPAGYHLTSLLIHAANAALVFLGVLALLPFMGGHPEGHRWMAAAAALFYGVHPLRVESVTWVTERRDVLCGFFLLLSLLAYLRLQREPERRGRWLTLSVLLFAASLLSKSLGLLYPAALAALDACPLRRMEPGRRLRVLLEKVPFVLVAAVDAAVMLQAMTHIQAVRTLGDYNLLERAMQAAYGLCFYVWKTLVPVALSPLYLIENPMNPWAPRYVACAALVAGAAAGLWAVRRRRWPGPAAAGFAYAVLVAPVLGLVVTGRQVVADRYSYLSCLPWSFLLAAGLARMPRSRALPLSAVGLAALAALAVVQVGIWKDSFTLWDHAARLDPGNHVAFADRGIARAVRGDSEGALRDFDRALELEPKDPQTYRNRGLTRFLMKDYAGAIADYTASLERAPAIASSWLARADARLAAGDLRGAFDDFSRSLQLEPTEPAAAGRARVMAILGDLLSRQPGDIRLWQLRGDLRRRLGDPRGAIADYGQAVERDPGFGRGFAARGLARVEAGDPHGAIADFTRAIELGSDAVEMHANRAYQRIRTGDRAGAVADFESAIRLAPPGALRATLEADLARAREGP